MRRRSPWPDPTVFPLPSADDSGWYDMLESAVRALVPFPGQGTFHKRLTLTLGKAARKSHRCGTGARFPKAPLVVRRVHRPLFSPYRSSPTFQYPSAELLAALASRPLLEVGAGAGVMGLLVSAAGGDIVTTDPRPWPMGRSYDFRDSPEDRTFAERHRASRMRAACPRFDGLRHPWKSALKGPMAPMSRSCSGRARMSFRKIRRYPRNFRDVPSFHPVRVMDAGQAVAAYPGRDILLLSPDPMDDGWAWELLASLPLGTRVFHADDFSPWRTEPPRGFRILATYQARFTGTVHDVLLMERIQDGFVAAEGAPTDVPDR